MSKRELGLKRMQEILGSKADEVIKTLDNISPDFVNYIVEFGYGEVYARPGITDKMREVAAVSSLISQGNTGLPLRAHLNGMLNVGWNKQEVLELIIFLTGYTGFPATVDAMKTAKEVFDSRNI